MAQPARLPISAPATGAVLVLAAAAGFGTNAVVAKLAYGSGATLASLLAVRYIASTAVLAPFAARARRRGTPRVRPAAAAAVGLSYVGSAASFWGALTLGDVSDIAPLTFTYPVIVAAAGYLLGERSGLTVPIAMAMCVAGLVLLFGTPSADSNDLLAKGLALLAGLLTAGYYLAGARIIRGDQGTQAAAVTCLLGVLVFVPAMLASGSLAGDLVDVWYYVALIILVGTAAPLLFMQWGMLKVGSTRASMLSLFEPVVTIALAFVVLRESPSASVLVGGALILAAVPVALAGQREEPERG